MKQFQGAIDSRGREDVKNVNGPSFSQYPTHDPDLCCGCTGCWAVSSSPSERSAASRMSEAREQRSKRRAHRQGRCLWYVPTPTVD
ncbi:hypothetical protein VTO42DRAFT_3817 [Malbranchea cinnamomea]